MRALTRKMEKKGWQDPSVEEILRMIEASIVRFKGTVAGLAEIARAESQMEAPPAPVDVAQVISDILLDLCIPIEQAGAVIEQRLNGCPRLTFSGKNLKSIFYNLISNAVKYRHPDRTPYIHISCHHEEDYLVISVQDNGLGLKTENENKVFGMFQRQHSHVEGTGVGLYIVKKIIENAGGKIRVESKPGQGSLFRVYFRQDGQSRE